MSISDTSSSAPSASSSLSAQQVEDYLRQNPDFLRDVLPGILADMPSVSYQTLAAALPDRPLGDGVADFQSYALRHLRQESDELRVGFIEMIDNAKTNQVLQDCTHRAALRALQADSFAELARVVSDQFPQLLAVDVAMLCFEAGLPKSAAVYVQEVPRGTFDLILGPEAQTCLRPQVDHEPLLYGSHKNLVHSDALVRLPLSASYPSAILVLGSHYPETFFPEQGSDLLTFLADVVSICVDRWVAL